MIKAPGITDLNKYYYSHKLKGQGSLTIDAWELIGMHESRIIRAILQHLRKEIIQVGIICKLSRSYVLRLEIYRTKYSRIVEHTIYCFNNHIELRYSTHCTIKTVELCNPDCFNIIVKALQNSMAKDSKDRAFWKVIRHH